MFSKKAGLLMLIAIPFILSSCGGGSPADSSVPTRSEPESSKAGMAAPTLREAAQQRGFYIGAALNYAAFSREPEYRKKLAEQYNIVTPENEMKFDHLHPERDRYTFDKADAIVAYAEENHMAVRGHTLVWHRSLPKWLEDGKWDREQLKAILKQHIQTVVGRYKGRLMAWDVVNEAFNDDGSYRDNLWYKAIGPEYIELAFGWAREADPQALLFYNDYTNEGMNAKSNRIYSMVEELKAKQTPIDGIGFQVHVRTQSYPASDKLKANIRRLSELGLQVHITEMDVKVNDAKSATNEEKLKLQADVYRSVLTACLEEKGCKALLTWGFTDKYSYIKEQDKNEMPLPFDERLQPKSAFQAMLDTLKAIK